MTLGVEPGTVVVFSDIACPWAHIAVHRLHERREALGLVEKVVFDHRAFPLEVVNRAGTSKPFLEVEIEVLQGLEPAAGWQRWRGEPWTWPVTMLLALEAVQAAKMQGHEAAEALDLALRKAFFGASRCISLRHVILQVAKSVPQLDVGRVQKDLDSGTARSSVLQDYESAGEAVRGSPHFFLPDGTDSFNPGMESHWDGKPGQGTLVIDRNDAAVYDDLLRRSVAPA